MIPRLERDHEVRYLRRGANGLLATLQRAFTTVNAAPIEAAGSDANQAQPSTAVVDLLD